MTNYYEIHENNSGGWRSNPADKAYIVIRAENETTARDILESQNWYTEDYCDCCGERWGAEFEKIKDFSNFPNFEKGAIIQYYDWDINHEYT